MKWKKYSADHVFDGNHFLPENTVIICTADGTIDTITNHADAGDDVQQFCGIISPGFVNCHCHLELSHMKGLIPEKTGLVDFVFSVVTQRHFPEEEVVDSVEKAEQEMISNGMVAVGDICNNLQTLDQKEQQNLRYYNFVESSGWLPDVANSRFERSKNAFDFFNEFSPTSIVPHAPYSVSENLWQLIQPYYAGKTVSIHNQETAFEDELFLQNTGDFVRMYELMKMDTSFFRPSGKSSLQTYFHKLEKAAQVILVHNTFTKQSDIDFAKQTRDAATVWFCLCANANLYIENALPPLDLLRKNDCNIVIGTDSLASNHSLSVLDEMKTIQHHFPSIGLEEMLRWATQNGAKALQIEDTVGSLQQGKKPGLVLIENVENGLNIKNSTVKKLL